MGITEAEYTMNQTHHDHEFIETVANRIIELTPNGIIDKMMEYDEYITSDHIKEMRARMYGDN